ncbi:MAG: chemotaxis protein CheX, partial [Bdellovibrionota bacterium]
LIELSSMRELLLIARNIRTNNKELYTVGAIKEIRRLLDSIGCGHNFGFIQDVSAMPVKETSAKGAAINVDIINPFVEATVKILKMQCQVDATIGRPFVKSETDQPPVELAGVINMTCDQFQGSVILCFCSAVFFKIYENMLGEKVSSITAEVEDAACELLNIIYGTAKATLNEKLKTNLKPSLPTVLSGEKIRVRHRTSKPIVVLPFTSTAGEFHIEIAIEDLLIKS